MLAVVRVAAGLGAGRRGNRDRRFHHLSSAMNGIVGLKPTLGLLAGKYIISLIAHSQDTAGPMTTSVKDAALLLAALVGDAPACDPPPPAAPNPITPKASTCPPH